MQDLRSLYNQALSAVGSAADVTDPERSSRSVDLLKLWYPVARRSVFTAAHWWSLRRSQRLTRALERDESLPWANSDPAPDFKYAFALPVDMLQPQYMENFSVFRLGRVGDENLLFTNDEFPILNYTHDDPNPARWEPDLYRAVVWALAACINMAKNGKAGLTQKLEQQVYDIVSDAAVNSANADDTYFDAVPSFYSGTGFAIPQVSTRFYYPTTTFRVSGGL
jgi:hypothetical protein